MKNVVTALGATTITTLALLGHATPARADNTDWYPVHEPWTAYVQGDLTLPAGRYCSFPATSTVESQNIRGRVTSRWNNGAVRTAFYAGPLYVTFTDLTTGASIEHISMSGTGEEYDDPDGRQVSYTMHGPVGFGFATGSTTDLPQGFYVLDGDHTVTFDPDGTRHLVVSKGTETNLCDKIG